MSQMIYYRVHIF